MVESGSNGSIFSQKLDRATFTLYFLGAIVPLLALAIVVQKYVLPDLVEKNEVLAMIAMVSSVSVLSLCSFLILRSVIRRTLSGIDRDNALNKHMATMLARLGGNYGKEEAKNRDRRQPQALKLAKQE